jgi:hypothetical protein
MYINTNTETDQAKMHGQLCTIHTKPKRVGANLCIGLTTCLFYLHQASCIHVILAKRVWSVESTAAATVKCLLGSGIQDTCVEQDMDTVSVKRMNYNRET